MYTFELIQNGRCPSVQGWWLVVKPGEWGTVDLLHARITQSAFLGGGHQLPADESKMSASQKYAYANPVKVGAEWVQRVSSQIMDGETVYVNASGGWCLKGKQDKVLATESRSELSWPDTKDDLWQGEIITIKQWGDGIHWYLLSNKSRIFDGKKNSLEAAKEVARQYVAEENIRVHKDFTHRKEGD